MKVALVLVSKVTQSQNMNLNSIVTIRDREMGLWAINKPSPNFIGGLKSFKSKGLETIIECKKRAFNQNNVFYQNIKFVCFIIVDKILFYSIFQLINSWHSFDF